MLDLLCGTAACSCRHGLRAGFRWHGQKKAHNAPSPDYVSRYHESISVKEQAFSIAITYEQGFL